MSDTSAVKCLVIGAGPVGALAALYAAERGWNVEVYELRGDLRQDATIPLNFTKSINLALSERGIHALRQLRTDNVLGDVLSDTIPMRGRMIHGRDNRGACIEKAQQYDIGGRSILAVDRAKLNQKLLDALEQRSNVKLHFNHKLTGADFQKRRAWLEQHLTSHNDDAQSDVGSRSSLHPSLQRHREIEVDFDIILGCDGAHSSVRYHMMKFVQMDYEQTYIDVLWSEFTIPSIESANVSSAESLRKQFALDPSYLHIWPGSDKMFIAIPNPNKSFTCTLFAPLEDYKSLEKDTASIVSFFESNFPGAADYIGRENLKTQFENNPHLPLISIKCSPYRYQSSGVILGDAAHAMVPFYGQGMNAGLEDVRVLFSKFDMYAPTDSGRCAALEAYTDERAVDAHVINDLALANYHEMHVGVTSSTYLLRKYIEELLASTCPGLGFATQYSRISFTNQRYSSVVKAVNRQASILMSGLCLTIAVPLVAGTIWTMRRFGMFTSRSSPMIRVVGALSLLFRK